MWLIEDPWPPILILGVLALVFGIAWNSTRRGAYFLTTIGLVALMLVVFIVEEMVVTEAEQIAAQVLALAEAVQSGEQKKVLAFFAEKAQDLKSTINSQLEDVQVQDDLRITDLQVVLDNTGSKATSHFRANGTVTYKKTLSHTGPTRWNLTWQKTGESWKVIQVERLDPIKGEVISTWGG